MKEASIAKTFLIGCIICIGVSAIFYFNPYRYYSSFYHTITNSNGGGCGGDGGGKKKSKKSDGDDGSASDRINSGGGDDHSSNSNNNKSTQSTKRTTKVRSRYVVEVCLSDIQSLMEACQGSCNSIELCVNRLEGGITASYALIEHSVRVIAGTSTTNNSNDSSSSINSNSLNRSIALHVLIRPRPGGFNYTDDEFDIIQRDVLIAKQLGADGIVFGALHDNGSIDVDRMRIIRKLSEGMMLTFHRAFDVCSYRSEIALEQIISLGCDRLLTSGGNESNAIYNLSAIQALVKLARGRIVIVAASGIGYDNVRQIITSTGVCAVHTGSSVTEIRQQLSINNSSSIIIDHDGPSKELFKTSLSSPSIALSLTSPHLSTITTTTTTATSSSSNVPSDMVGWSCTSRSLVSQLVDEAKLAWNSFETEGINYSKNTLSSSRINNSHDEDNGGRGDVDEEEEDNDGSDMVLVEAVDVHSPTRKVLPHDSTYVYVGE